MLECALESYRPTFERANQLHLYNQLEKLKIISREKFQALWGEVESLHLEEIWSKFKDAIEQSQKRSKLNPSDVSPVPIISKIDDSWYGLGLEEISKGRVAALVLAGGQGTRLGSEDPKGCFDIGLPGHESLFALQALKIQRAEHLAREAYPMRKQSTRVLWYIMVSDANKDATFSFFKKSNYFGIPSEHVFFFEQGKLPCLDMEGRILLESECTLAQAPNGNGGVYEALRESGALRHMKESGISHITAYSVDNVLALPVDPFFIGMVQEKEYQVAMKVVEKKLVEEKVGLVVSQNAHPSVVEYSEISEEASQATETVDGKTCLRLRAANIAYHYFSLGFLEHMSHNTRSLPVHLALKKIPNFDITHNQFYKPSSPNGYKLEMFIFDSFEQISIEKFGCLQVSRETSFSPLKNSLNATNDNQNTCLQDIYALGKKWILQNGGILEQGDCPFVAPSFSLLGESLEWIQGKHIREHPLY
ncbi:UDP-N-acetylglucosamine diphosphorylase Uap1/Qri1 [Schizosaccharomyces cryophilus OY26]|uniref:UDP-N-acetylglucosamine diphosphorylase n=1 Tax=Schizosaccharomyces cryophilus (strain OY26 / ATCC MYA-4695 / CBS 11777 / NBRC 106824 / NRRL Y48691) TaxID=653667 RepID=S9VVG3_SCHCR|nr:UDP-N-acetylglucosamine diphosphorylase Uap1/Qri1 [Schizosaccharomyces cryophilus OY26]EPY50154.1 UDP-N-acetylglucosamine diphosphorylase Uap1/Qri1 [Schizosaccharomyces cryophilus OY26]